LQDNVKKATAPLYKNMKIDDFFNFYKSRGISYEPYLPDESGTSRKPPEALF